MKIKKQYIGKRRGVDKYGKSKIDGTWAVPRLLRTYYIFKANLWFLIQQIKFTENSTVGATGDVKSTNTTYFPVDLPGELFGVAVAPLPRPMLHKIYNSGGYGILVMRNDRLAVHPSILLKYDEMVETDKALQSRMDRRLEIMKNNPDGFQGMNKNILKESDHGNGKDV